MIDNKKLNPAIIAALEAFGTPTIAPPTTDKTDNMTQQELTNDEPEAT